MDGAKIRLSEEEKMLVADGSWILTKNRVLGKANALLTQVMADQSDWIKIHSTTLPAELVNTSPKISRGENYNGLPWLMLDYPRLFSKTETAAIRCFFWWGHYFSITLQLEGNARDRSCPNLAAAWNALSEKQYYAGISPDRWHHAVTPEHYRPVIEMDEAAFARYVHEHPFVKLTLTLPLEYWDLAAKKLAGESVFLLELLAR